MSDLKWQDPPPNAAGRPSLTDWRAVAAALRERPGEWALVVEGVSISTATNIKKARLVAFAPAGSFEAVARNGSNKTKRADIYARYVGESA